MKTLSIANGLTLLSLLALLIGCGAPNSNVIRVPVETVRVEKVKVPDALLEPCTLPDLDSLETTGDMERVANEALEAARCGNEDKAAIREWQSK